MTGTSQVTQVTLGRAALRILLLVGAFLVLWLLAPASARADGGLGDLIGSATQTATGVVDEATEAVTGTVDEATDTVTGTVDQATGAVGQGTGAATGAVVQTIGAVTGAVEETVGTVTGAIEETVDGVVQPPAIAPETPVPADGPKGDGSSEGPVGAPEPHSSGVEGARPAPVDRRPGPGAGARLDRSAARALPGVAMTASPSTTQTRHDGGGFPERDRPLPARSGGALPSTHDLAPSTVRGGSSSQEVAVLAATILLALALVRRPRRESGLRFSPGFLSLAERPG